MTSGYLPSTVDGATWWPNSLR